MRRWLRTLRFRSTWWECDYCGRRGRWKAAAHCAGGRPNSRFYCDGVCRLADEIDTLTRRIAARARALELERAYEAGRP